MRRLACTALGTWALRGCFRLGWVLAVMGTIPARADDWLELRTPHFRVISEVAERRTREWAIEFELFRRGMSLVMPVNPAWVDPVTLVLFSSDRRMRPFKMVENGQPAGVAGFFTQAGGQKIIAVSVEGSRDRVRELVFHEAVHWHLSAADRPRPMWLDEGLAEVFGNFRLSGDTFVIGAFRPDFMRHVQVAKPLPFAQMMALGSAGLNYNGAHADQTALFYHQAWLMVHELIFGSKGVGYQSLRAYLMTPPQYPDPTEDFARGFGVESARMDARLADYLARGRFFRLIFPFNRKTVDAGFVLLPNPGPEVDLTLGNLLAGVGRPVDAEPYLLRATAGLPEDARVAEAMAHLDVALKRSEAAAENYRESIRRGGGSYQAHFFLAQRSLLAKGGNGFGAGDPTEAAGHLMRCLRSNPRFEPGYEALGRAAALLPACSKEVEELIGQGAARFPANARIQAGVACIAAQNREWDRARDAAQRADPGLADPTDPLALRIREILAEARRR